eukprot:gene2505-2544_t
MSRYSDVYARWQQEPEGFWLEAAKAIDWYQAPVKAFDKTSEPGRVVHYKPLLDEAIELADYKPSACLIFQRPQETAKLVEGRDYDWAAQVAAAKAAGKHADCVELAATHLANYDLSHFRSLFLAGERADPDTVNWAEQVLKAIYTIRLYYWPDRDTFIRRVGGNGDINALFGGDFISFWMGARLIVGNKIAVLFQAQGLDHVLDQYFNLDFPLHAWSYPPHFMMLIWPIGLMPYMLSFFVYSTIGLTFFVGLSAYFVQPSRRIWLAAALVFAPATMINLFNGETGFLIAIFMLHGLRLLKTRPILAGFFFVLLTAKPQFGLVLPFALICMGQWRAIASTIAFTAVWIGASILIFGMQAWIGFFGVNLPYQLNLLTDFDKFDFYLSMMPSTLVALHIVGASLTLAIAAQVVVAVTAITLCVIGLRRTQRDDLRVALIVTATFLATPYIFNYDMPILIAALTIYLLNTKHMPFDLTFVSALIWLIPTAIFLMNDNNLPLSPLAFLLCLRLLLREALRLWLS